MDTSSLLFLALGLLVGGFLGVCWGVRKENLRVQRIFGSTTKLIYGGAVAVVWERINRCITSGTMLDRLRELQERKDRKNKRLVSYESEYGRAPIDL